MNLALVLKLITQLAAFAESKPGSKGRAKNLSMAALLGICSTILFYSAGTPEKLANLDKRLAVIEHELRISNAVATATNAPLKGLPTQAGSTPADPRAKALTFLRKGDL